MGKWENAKKVKMSKCLNVWICENVKMWKCENVKMWKCDCING